ncbi:hypothetical protein [Embleya hyalina]|uniref:Uncharacterized protein n=1 Tax=Embleya hyalina TaxID=516124 RepID=A0A401Z6P4_9ACTN|nr:hypothetical protein [Embleya hyalina]GCE02486.1 hypothetical protein EHYA_10263 [Embleya hyalina]
MTGDSTIRFIAPATGPVEHATPPEPALTADTFEVGSRVRREETRWRDSGEVIGVRTGERGDGPILTVRRWSDRALYDAPASELVPDPVVFPTRPF